MTFTIHTDAPARQRAECDDCHARMPQKWQDQAGHVCRGSRRVEQWVADAVSKRTNPDSKEATA